MLGISALTLFLKLRTGSEHSKNAFSPENLLLGSFSISHPLNPNISMYILHTVLYTLLKVLTRRICITINSFFSWWSFLYSRDLIWLSSGIVKVTLRGQRSGGGPLQTTWSFFRRVKKPEYFEQRRFNAFTRANQENWVRHMKSKLINASLKKDIILQGILTSFFNSLYFFLTLPTVPCG